MIDDDGNIYLAGRGDNGSTSEDDVQAVSFDDNGAFRWARRYDGVGHWHDEGQALILDGLGNLRTRLEETALAMESPLLGHRDRQRRKVVRTCAQHTRIPWSPTFRSKQRS